MLATTLIGIGAIASVLYAGEEAKEQVAGEPRAIATDRPFVFDAILIDQASCPEATTTELRAALESGSAVVLDARPFEEYAVSHIPGAKAVPGKPGTTPALYVADVNTVLSTIADKISPLFCTATVSIAAGASDLGMSCSRPDIGTSGGANWELPSGGRWAE